MNAVRERHIGKLINSRAKFDEGFTLIELLVVIIIIGILAAIAIPTLLSQRQKAVDASMKQDLTTVATEENTYFVDNPTYVAISTFSGNTTVGADTVALSTGNTAQAVINNNGTAFCVSISNPKGSRTGSGGTGYWVYVSDMGGFQSGGTYASACPAAAGSW
jgi:type IV pilus assembly protein PilA